MATKLDKVIQESYPLSIWDAYATANIIEGTNGLAGNDILQGGNGSDAIYGELRYLTLTAQGDLNLVLVIGNDELYGSNAGDLLVGDIGFFDLIPSGDLKNVNAKFGDDYLDGGNGKDVLCGDQLVENTIVKYDFENVHAHWGHDELHGGNGDDILVGDIYLHYELVSEEGGTGSELIFTHTHEMGHDHLCGEKGNDIMVGDEAIFIFEVSGTVVMDFTELFAADELYGESGNDVLVGDTFDFSLTVDGNDVDIVNFTLIFGDDKIVGGKGNDILYGDYITLSAPDATHVEKGQDTFYFDLRANDGLDQIMDFDYGDDSLAFVLSSGSTIGDIDSAIKSIKSDGSDGTLVSFKNGASIDFVGEAYVGQSSITDMVAQDSQILVATSSSLVC